VRYLRGARELGELLVVAVNGDRSGAAIKDPGRPIMKEDERAARVDALDCVDYVVLFDEPDVSGVLDVLKPAIHAKGTDYSEQTVPERNIVLSYGGTVRIVGDPKNHSTRDLIAKIRESHERGAAKTEEPSHQEK
jgi:rfaE bifunctional protein nucleotidyltransferase chain/domain